MEPSNLPIGGEKILGPSSGLQGSEGIEGTDNLPSSDGIQSQSLSAKQNKLFSLFTSGEFDVYHYKKQLLCIPRYAIKNQRFIDKEFLIAELVPIEQKIFNEAIEFLKKAKSTKEIIDERLQQSIHSPSQCVALVDIFATVKGKTPDCFKIKKGEKELAETHTICLWKKTETQYMVIDPSSSALSKRLKQTFESIFRGEEKCNLVEHLEEKFYTLPEGTTFERKSVKGDKKRDCIDVALKIGFVLNEGATLYDNASLVQHSINLLSNQSAVNPALGSTNNGTFMKNLQSTRLDRRASAINAFSSIPAVFKNYFTYNAWLIFTGEFSDKDQTDILKVLTDLSKEIFDCKNFFGANKAENEFRENFKRLKNLSSQTDRFMSLRKDFGESGELTLKLKAIPQRNANTKKTMGS